ncbi:hypothetical protein OKA04_03675 [Luteolibacter flavescens]|uniref:Lipoprotein n=1 Tax=Luteolibacter flavescens TaxID=1859460 RepID=A0ABT3FJR9_9BACT|nr:hypothetical protein [Luteolibacter flavescens]MCW1883813.1 hypothetical protein [Luteolibacter flavescens]
MKSALLAALAFTSCVPMTQTWNAGWNAGWTEKAAQDRIMLVRNAPETLGHRRLVYQSAAHPDLGVFLESRGMPDFIAETSSDDRQYLILYYLDTRRAFACRTHRATGSTIDFAGPYQMTERETKVLRNLKRESGE